MDTLALRIEWRRCVDEARGYRARARRAVEPDVWLECADAAERRQEALELAMIEANCPLPVAVS